MNVTEYADVINRNIKMVYYHNQNNRWCASLENAEVIEGTMLASTYGNGSTPDEALKEYIKQIEGKTIVFNAMGGDKRREYKVPMNLKV